MKALVSASLAALALTAGSASAQTPCQDLASLKIEDVNLLSATEVSAAGDLPAYCRVLGVVRPAINFEVRLPQDWNGKFYMAGCGGFCGRLLSDAPGFSNAMNFGLRRSYAVSTMDGGHWGSSVVDGRWALSNPVAEMDWGQRAVTETARATKALIKARYAQDPAKSYFAGCSTGGRMAAMEASRYPADFDGVISGAPALDYTGLVATFFAWVAQANRGPDGKPIFTHQKLKLVQDAVTKACDGADGVEDGMVSAPEQCSFKPASLQCKPGAEGPDCLTAPEVGVLEKWYAGPTNSRGEALYPGGIPLGSEANWARWLTGTGTAPALLPVFAGDFLRYMAFVPDPGPDYSIQDFDFDRDPPRLAPMSRVYNVTTFGPGTKTLAGTDLSAFAKRGGRMILYHGWGDPLVTPRPTVEYYEGIAKAAGGMDQARDFTRLFMVPGMDHCGINTAGPGIADTGIDPLTALERWVENGTAPDTLLATKADASGAPRWRRPICAYPQVARFNGGDPAQPESFACTAP